MSCLLSPGHVLVYMLFLPTLPSDPRPSTTVFTTIFIGCILSLQLFTLQASFSQQSKDTAIIHKEVQHEYDTKFVHPRMNPVVRDVGIQCDADYSTSKHVTEVDTYTPTTIINKGFQTHPNPNYSKHVDPDGVSDIPQRPDPRNILSPLNPAFQTPAVYNRQGGSTPFRPSTGMRQPHFRPNPGADGGSLGVYSHADSPLKKSASANVLRSSNAGRDGTGRQGAAIKREGSPLKRSSVPGGMTGLPQGQRFAHLGVGTPNRRESGYF
ncbi:MAG: hypothetical protein M1833_004022 [Piccolia ochrophora]|nr:MAG: hypothetical protein M1833_004022 [Piccolia ochrophora]